MREQHYKVTWIVDVNAESPLDAARKARAIQQDKHSQALYFHRVQNIDSGEEQSVDLGEVTLEGEQP